MTDTANSESSFKDPGRINWYRTPVDREVMQTLVERSDWKGARQAVVHLLMAILTGSVAFIAFKQIGAETWWWAVPLLLVAMFLHGTIASFFGGVACHELGHDTVFKTKWLNRFFLYIYAFLGWWDHVWFYPSHRTHHRVTVHHGYDGEVVLPMRLNFKDWRFWLGLFAWNPMTTWQAIVTYFNRARGKMDNEWFEYVMPEEEVRRKHRNWARLHLALHAVLAVIFIATGNWILVFLVNIPSHYCGWLGFLCGTPQHYGMQPDVPDFRLCCRTYTTRGLPAFLYWNMQYHIEHHMFPGVPCYNLPRLRQAVEHDYPAAPQGLKATWQEILAIHRRQQSDSDYYLPVDLPHNNATTAAE